MRSLKLLGELPSSVAARPGDSPVVSGGVIPGERLESVGGTDPGTAAAGARPGGATTPLGTVAGTVVGRPLAIVTGTLLGTPLNDDGRELTSAIWDAGNPVSYTHLTLPTTPYV